MINKLYRVYISFTTHKMDRTEATELHFNILYDLSDDLSSLDYFSFVTSNELTNELLMCREGMVRRFEFYQYCYPTVAGCSKYDTVKVICQNEDMDVFKWIHHNVVDYRLSYSCYGLVADLAIKSDNQEVIVWLCDIGSNVRRMCAVTMAKYGKLDMLKWGHFMFDFFDHDKTCGYDTMNSACSFGHLDIIKWLYEIQSEYLRIGFYDNLEYPYVINRACVNGHYNVVMFFLGEYQKGCIPLPLCSENNLAHTIKHGRSDMTEIIDSNYGELWTADKMVRLARRYNNLDVVKFACKKLESYSPSGNPKDIISFVKNKVTGHHIKYLKSRKNPTSDEIIDWFVETYRFKK